MEPTNNTARDQGTTSPRKVPPFMVANAFGVAFLDEAFCTRFFLDGAHGRLAHCPECKEEITDDRQERRYYEMKKFTCKSCRQVVTAKKGTVLENCSLTPRQYILLALFLEAGESSANIGRFVGMSAENVRIWKGKLNV